MSPSPHSRQPDRPEPDSIEFDFGSLGSQAPAIRTKKDRPDATPPPPPPPSPGSIPGQTALPGFAALFAAAFFIPCIVALLWLSLPVAFRVEAGLRYPYQLDAEEGFLHQQALDLNAGRSIYTPIDEEPYLVGNYPPLYPLMVAGALRAGLEGLEAGRMVVALSLVLIVLFLFGTARILSGRWIIALLPPLLFVVSYELYNWVVFCRVDLPALAFTLIGVFIFNAFASRDALVFSAIFFVLAAYTRQTSLMAPMACAAVLLLKDRRGLAWFLVPYLVGGLGLFVAVNIRLEGEFWRHLVEYNRNQMDWGVLKSVLRNEVWFFYRWWIVALALGGAVAAFLAVLKRRSETYLPVHYREAASRRPIFIALYFVLSALSLSAFAKSGSAPNYALEPLAASGLLLAFILGRLLESISAASTSRRWIAWVGTLLVATCLSIHVIRMLPVEWSKKLPSSAQSLGRFMDERRVGWALFSSRNPDEQEVHRGDRVVAEIHLSPGEVLSEHPIFAIEAGRPVIFQPFIMTTLAREGRWDQEPFLADLRSGRFAIIVTTQDLRAVRNGAVLARYTPEMAEAILDRYELRGGMPPGPLGIPYFIWRPRDSAGE